MAKQLAQARIERTYRQIGEDNFYEIVNSNMQHHPKDFIKWSYNNEVDMYIAKSLLYGPANEDRPPKLDEHLIDKLELAMYRIMQDVFLIERCKALGVQPAQMLIDSTEAAVQKIVKHPRTFLALKNSIRQQYDLTSVEKPYGNVYNKMLGLILAGMEDDMEMK